MADLYMNRILLCGEQDKIDTLLEAVRYDTMQCGTIDFRKVIPFPQDEEVTQDWIGQHWGLDRNSIPCEQTEEDAILFQTAWGNAARIVQALAGRFPDVEMEYQWASERIGDSAGLSQFIEGQCVAEVFWDDGSRAAIEQAAALWGVDEQEEMTYAQEQG